MYHWGVSPAIDFLDVGVGKDMDEVNVLLIGQADCRHIIKTLANKYKHEDKQVNFYVVENCMEIIARQMVMSLIMLEPLEDIGLQNKTLMFMEFYGNSLVRPSTTKYIANKSYHLRNMITDSQMLFEKVPMFDISYLKYKQRDYLDTLFKFWSSPNRDFDIVKIWDNNLRRLTKTRYDCRNGIFDWDYHMRIKCDTDINTICVQEYKYFRDTGISFTRLDCEYFDANLSLAAGIIQDGDKMFISGYLGDMSTGPYITYGLDCEDKDMLKVANRANVKRVTDIIERNITRYFHEIATGSPYVHQEVLDENAFNAGSAFFLLPDAKQGRCVTIRHDHSPWKPLLTNHKDKIYFAGAEALKDLINNSNKLEFFDAMFLGHHMFRYLSSDLIKLCKKGAEVFFETRAAAYVFTKDNIKAFGAQIKEFAEANNLVPSKDFDPIKDCISNFVKC